MGVSALSEGVEALPEDGEVLFGQGVILRKISKFVLGSDEDGVIPIPVFYDLISKKYLKTNAIEIRI